MVLVDKEKCIGCGLCSNDCPSKVITLENKKASITQSECLRCGHCVAICPVSAFKIDEYDMSEVEEYGNNQPHLDEKDLIESLKSRRSIRKYQKKGVERKKIEKIIEAGRYTPTGTNAQDVSYIVVEDDIPILENEALKFYKRLVKISGLISMFVKLPISLKKLRLKEGFFFHGAPTVILVISKNVSNATLAAMSMELMAEAQGLGTLYVGLFTRAANKNKKIRTLLGLKKNEKIMQCIAIGYPDVKYQRTAPKKKADIQWR
ncbi:nitroreductase family protein [Wukongibacter sp. M2B1]|uniref:nitroreductase family protein n=1 Tax=Wukongibacter sp. M2B1 TaxID=3088895 RepID=UPI003D7BC0B8